MQLRFRPIAGAAVSLGGYENVLTKRREHRTVHFFRPPLPVINGIIEIVDPQLVRAECDGLGLLKGDQRESPSGLSDHCEFLTRFPEQSLRKIPGFRLRRLSSVSRSGKPRENP